MTSAKYPPYGCSGPLYASSDLGMLWAFNVEDAYTPQRLTHGAGYVTSGMWSLAKRCTDYLRTRVSKTTLHHTSPEPEETSRSCRPEVFSKRTRVAPVAKADSISAWPSSECNDETGDHDHYKRSDLDRGEDEFRFPK